MFWFCSLISTLHIDIYNKSYPSCMYVCIYERMYGCINVWYVCMYVCNVMLCYVMLCMYLWTNVWMYQCMKCMKCMYVCNVCMYVCMYVCKCIYIYIYIHQYYIFPYLFLLIMNIINININIYIYMCVFVHFYHRYIFHIFEKKVLQYYIGLIPFESHSLVPVLS